MTNHFGNQRSVGSSYFIQDANLARLGSANVSEAHVESVDCSKIFERRLVVVIDAILAVVDDAIFVHRLALSIGDMSIGRLGRGCRGVELDAEV